MKIIFLDIDGVLRTHKSDVNWSKKLSCDIKKGTDRLFCEKSVDLLNELLVISNAKIVVTSNWRLTLTIEELSEKFRERGLLSKAYAITSINFNKKNTPIAIGNRGLEIKEWLNNNFHTDYVVVDDQISDLLEHIPKSRIIKVNPLIGLSSKNIDDAIDILL